MSTMLRQAICFGAIAGMMLLGAGCTPPTPELPPAPPGPAEKPAASASSSDAAAGATGETKPSSAAADSPKELLKQIVGAEQTAAEERLSYPESLARVVSITVSAADKLAAHPEATAAQKSEAAEYKLDVLTRAAQLDREKYAEPCRAYCLDLAKTQPDSPHGKMAAVFPFVLDVLHIEPLPADASQQLLAIAEKHPTSPILPKIVEILSRKLVRIGKTDEASQLLTQSVKLITAAGEEKAAETLQARAQRVALLGKEMSLVAPTLDGPEFDLKSLRGKVVLIDMWASWCPTCLEWAPEFHKLEEKYKDEGFAVVAVNLDDEVEALRDFLKESPSPWPQVLVPADQERGLDSKLAREFGVKLLPGVFLIGRDGKLISDEFLSLGEIAAAVHKAVRGIESSETPNAAPADGAAKDAAPAAATEAGEPAQTPAAAEAP